MMKRIADLLTWSRYFIATCVFLLSAFFGEQALPTVFVLLLAGWTTDAVDGPLARREPHARHTWVGDNDALADTALAASALVAFSACGYISLWLVAIFLLLQGTVAICTRSQVLNMTFLALIHAFTLYGSFRYSTLWGILAVSWCLVVMALNWRRFTFLVSFFIHGMARLPRAEGIEREEENNQGESHAFLRN